MSPPRAKRNGKPTVTARYPPRTGATTATVVKVAVTPANRPARFAGLVSRTSNELPGSQNNRRETRNGGGAGGAETIRAAPTHPRVQRDFAPSSAFHGRPRSLAIDSATRAVRRRAEGHHVPATIDSSKSRIAATLSTLSRAEDAVMPTRMENALGGSTENNASSVQSSPAARMKSHGSRARRVAK